MAAFGDLRRRAVSGTLLAALTFAVIWVGGWPFALLATLGVGAMLVELRAMTLAEAGRSDLRRAALWALPALGLLTAAATGFVVAAGVAIGLLLVPIAWDLRMLRARGVPVAAAGGVAIVIAGTAFLAIRDFAPHGALTAFWVILTVAAADIGGYFAGRLIGGPRLWAAVSPKKTWAGLGGGMVLAFLAGGVFSWATTGTYFQEVCTVSALAALVAQGGDLAESALKRHYGVKDASGLIPGHGGVLDRCDGLMAATLIAAAVTYWRGQTVFIW